jgi:CxxC-x17-CxxC domain-containing protein
LYEAICADCHKVCEVPFRPSEDRPVYCKECFAKRRCGGSGKAFPVLTPVALAPKPASKLGKELPAPPGPSPAKKPQKKQPQKKAKKKK